MQTDGRTDKHTDMTKLTVAFDSFGVRPQNGKYKKYVEYLLSKHVWVTKYRQYSKKLKRFKIRCSFFNICIILSLRASLNY